MVHDNCMDQFSYFFSYTIFHIWVPIGGLRWDGLRERGYSQTYIE